MADTKISGLADLASLADDDELPVLDLSASTTKSVTVANLRTAVSAGYSRTFLLMGG